MTLDARLLDLMLRAGSAWVLYLLLLLSLAAVAVVLERLWFFRNEKRPGPPLDEALGGLAGPETREPALRRLEPLRGLETAIARACLTHAESGAASVEEHVRAVVERERLRYERGLAFLGTLGSNAPFIGLFGTVLGIIRSFHDLAEHSAQATQAVMAGIAEALVATGVGLLVALPAVAAYNAFTRYVETRVAGGEAAGHVILAWIKARRTEQS